MWFIAGYCLLLSELIKAYLKALQQRNSGIYIFYWTSIELQQLILWGQEEGEPITQISNPQRATNTPKKHNTMERPCVLEVKTSVHHRQSVFYRQKPPNITTPWQPMLQQKRFLSQAIKFISGSTSLTSLITSASQVPHKLVNADDIPKQFWLASQNTFFKGNSEINVWKKLHDTRSPLKENALTTKKPLQACHETWCFSIFWNPIWPQHLLKFKQKLVAF